MADVRRLLDRFSDLIRKGAGHIYITALPWTAPSALWSQYEALKLELHLPQYPSRDGTLEHLATSLSTLSRNPRESIYLVEAIRIGQEVLQLRPAEHPDHSHSLAYLAAYLSDRFDVTDDVRDPSKAICVGQEVMQLHLAGDSYGHFLHNLSVYLSNRFHATKDTDDLSEAIQLGRELLALWPEGHPGYASASTNLDMCLQRFSGSLETVGGNEEEGRGSRR